ncbi:hypothetical protein BS78_08G053300 [Paspalum vaginatum]|nr:hypothetical protein BS78_08G053300 [Paspalum vaginatum]
MKDLRQAHTHSIESAEGKDTKMKSPPSLLVLCLAILAAVLIISSLAVHAQQAQGMRQPSAPPPPDPSRPFNDCCGW